MKLALASCASFIHVIALSLVAGQIAERENWHWSVAIAAWAAGGMLGLFPIVRTIAFVGMCFYAFPWQIALWAAPLAAVLMCVMEGAGTTYLKLKSMRPM